jgi:hypothetical protein
MKSDFIGLEDPVPRKQLSTQTRAQANHAHFNLQNELGVKICGVVVEQTRETEFQE